MRRSGPISAYSQSRDVQNSWKSLGWSWVVLIVSSPGLGPLAAVLARPSSPGPDCPRKHKHTHNAVPCHAMPRHAFAMQMPILRLGNLTANPALVSQPTSTKSKMQCTSPVCFLTSPYLVPVPSRPRLPVHLSTNLAVRRHTRAARVTAATSRALGRLTSRVTSTHHLPLLFPGATLSSSMPTVPCPEPSRCTKICATLPWHLPRPSVAQTLSFLRPFLNTDKLLDYSSATPSGLGPIAFHRPSFGTSLRSP
jgi:hypothetical protein